MKFGSRNNDTGKINHLISESIIYFLFFILLFSLFSAIGGLNCKKPTQPDDKPPSSVSYEWKVDTLVYDLPGIQPDQVSLQCIWGSSPRSVWAVGNSDIVQGQLWHYNGVKWRPVRNWPYSGIDEGGSYINDVYSVTGFDSSNVFVFGFHGYDTTGTCIVLKWNGHTWSTLPWREGKAPRGGLGWGVKQNNDKLWAVSSTGHVIKYENGYLSTEPQFTDYRLGISQIAALDNGKVYVNAFKDSLIGDTLLMGSITNLFKRDISGNWSLIERKFIAGAYYDGYGLGRGVLSVGNRLFTSNRGLWEFNNGSWKKILDIYFIGGICFLNENNLWVYRSKEIWHLSSEGWKFVDIPLLSNYQNFFLYGQGWSDGSEIFIIFKDGSKTFILHGKKKGG